MKGCEEKGVIYLRKKYDNYFPKEMDDLENMCRILSEYLEPNTVRVMTILENTYFSDIGVLKKTLKENNFVVRCEEDLNSDQAIKRLYDILIDTNKSYLMEELFDRDVFVSLKKIGDDRVYEFIEKWSENYMYFNKLSISASMYNVLKTTVKKSEYICYRGLNFDRNNLRSFWDNVKNIKKDGSALINFGNFTSWTTDSKIATMFMQRENMRGDRKKNDKQYQLILKNTVNRKHVLADLEKFDPKYDQKELILHPGTYDVKVYVYDRETKKLMSDTKIWDRSVDIE